MYSEKVIVSKDGEETNFYWITLLPEIQHSYPTIDSISNIYFGVNKIDEQKKFYAEMLELEKKDRSYSILLYPELYVHVIIDKSLEQIVTKIDIYSLKLAHLVIPSDVKLRRKFWRKT